MVINNCMVNCLDGQVLVHRLHQEGRTTKRAKRPPTKNEIIWAAGFLEGEGSFTTTSWNPHGVRTRRVTCRQVNIEPLQRLLDSFGGSLVFITAPSQIKVKISEWRCSGSRAVIVMRLIYSQMSKKRQKQISNTLFCKTRKVG